VKQSPIVDQLPERRFCACLAQTKSRFCVFGPPRDGNETEFVLKKGNKDWLLMDNRHQHEWNFQGLWRLQSLTGKMPGIAYRGSERLWVRLAKYHHYQTGLQH